MTKTKHLVIARHEAISSQNGLASNQIASYLVMTGLWVAGNTRVGTLSDCSRYKEQEVEYVHVETMGLFPPQIAGDCLLKRIHEYWILSLGLHLPKRRERSRFFSVLSNRPAKNWDSPRRGLGLTATLMGYTRAGGSPIFCSSVSVGL